MNPELQAARRGSLTVGCPDCHAAQGEICRGIGGQPLGRLPAHPRRLLAAGITLRPVDEQERRDPWHRPTLTAREQPLDRDALKTRRAELLSDRAAGDNWSQAKAAELIRIDEALHPDRPHIDPDEDHRVGRGANW